MSSLNLHDSSFEDTIFLFSSSIKKYTHYQQQFLSLHFEFQIQGQIDYSDLDVWQQIDLFCIQNAIPDILILRGSSF